MKTTVKEARLEIRDASLADSMQASSLLKPNRMTRERYQELINIKRDRDNEMVDFRKLFFYLGLSISLFFVTVVINWKSYDKLEVVDLGSLTAEFDDLIEVPVSTQPPPPPPKQTQSINIVEVDDAVVIEEIELNLDVEMTEATEIEDHNIDFTVEPIEEEKVEEIFTVVENWPEPKGGMNAFYQYVGDNIEYPQLARRLNVQGIVFVQFVVEKDGRVTDVKVVRGIGAGCDEEAVRVLKAAPAWNPGNQRGRPVRVLMTVPIRFVLKQGN